MKIRNECLDTGVSSIERDESPQPHRPECVGRPAGLPPIKLTDLLTEEPENTDSGEIDTGATVSNIVQAIIWGN